MSAEQGWATAVSGDVHRSFFSREFRRSTTVLGTETTMRVSGSSMAHLRPMKLSYFMCPLILPVNDGY